MSTTLPVTLRVFCLARHTLIVRIACALLLPLSAIAQTGDGASSISGRIFNPVTGEYVRNAQIRIEGRSETAVSEDGGYYRLTGVAPGNVTLVVSYTGYQPTTATIHLDAGTAITRDFELTSGLQPAPVDGAPVKL